MRSSWWKLYLREGETFYRYCLSFERFGPSLSIWKEFGKFNDISQEKETVGEVDKIARIFENENDVFTEMFNMGCFKGNYFVDPGSLHNRLSQKVNFDSPKNGKLRQSQLLGN